MSREVPKCKALKAAEMRLKAFESKIRKYSCGLNKVEIKSHTERHKKTDRNEILPRN